MRKDFGLRRMIDARLVPADQEERTPGDAVAGMRRHGGGVATRPRSLTPPFFTTKPLDLLWRPGGRAARCTRGTRGRTLADGHAAGCALWWSALALAGCAPERLEPRFPPLAPPRFSLSGPSGSERGQHAMALTHGYAQAHRPDLPQVV